MGDISNEPSMEDILASIKRIIADDPGVQKDAAGTGELEAAVTAQPVAQAFTATSSESDVLELAADQCVNEEVAPAPLKPIAPVVSPLAEPKPVASLLAEKRAASTEPLLSKSSAEASRNSFADLSKLIVRQEDAASNTLEGLVRDLLKPMIKPWLDDNLPAIVERAVALEVARLTGRTS